MWPLLGGLLLLSVCHVQSLASPTKWRSLITSTKPTELYLFTRVAGKNPTKVLSSIHKKSAKEVIAKASQHLTRGHLSSFTKHNNAQDQIVQASEAHLQRMPTNLYKGPLSTSPLDSAALEALARAALEVAKPHLIHTLHHTHFASASSSPKHFQIASSYPTSTIAPFIRFPSHDTLARPHTSGVIGHSLVSNHVPTNHHLSGHSSANIHTANHHSNSHHLTNPHLTNPHLTNPQINNPHINNHFSTNNHLISHHPAEPLPTIHTSHLTINHVVSGNPTANGILVHHSTGNHPSHSQLNNGARLPVDIQSSPNPPPPPPPPSSPSNHPSTYHTIPEHLPPRHVSIEYAHQTPNQAHPISNKPGWTVTSNTQTAQPSSTYAASVPSAQLEQPTPVERKRTPLPKLRVIEYSTSQHAALHEFAKALEQLELHSLRDQDVRSLSMIDNHLMGGSSNEVHSGERPAQGTYEPTQKEHGLIQQQEFRSQSQESDHNLQMNERGQDFRTSPRPFPPSPATIARKERASFRTPQMQYFGVQDCTKHKHHEHKNGQRDSRNRRTPSSLNELVTFDDTSNYLGSASYQSAQALRNFAGQIDSSKFTHNVPTQNVKHHENEDDRLNTSNEEYRRLNETMSPFNASQPISALVDAMLQQPGSGTLEHAKLDMKVIHLPVSVLKRLVGEEV